VTDNAPDSFPADVSMSADILDRVRNAILLGVTRQNDRIRILADGRIEVVDPRLDDLSILRLADPSYSIATAHLRGFDGPRLLSTRSKGAGIRRSEMASADSDALWKLHQSSLATLRALAAPAPALAADEATLMDLKLELASRELTCCRLCARECRVDRQRGEIGFCGLGDSLAIAEQYVHIAEEAPINPSYVISTAGCGLRCRFCQQWPLLSPSSLSDIPPSVLWSTVMRSGAKSLSFAGGNPDESLPGILSLLATVPNEFDLPLVWNSHAYSTLDALSLLDGVVDVFLPDLKFGSEACGRAIAGVMRYPQIAERSIEAMVAQGSYVIVRILVLPGHVECCHLPALRSLALLASDRTMVSVRGQYSPDYRVANGGPLDRRPGASEVERVRRVADQLGLTSVDDIDTKQGSHTVTAC
jgi:putative pyruvate formate lyase activating enzyme